MIILDESRAFYLEAGEQIPFICPRCQWPEEYKEGLDTIKCSDCGHVGTPNDFGQARVALCSRET